MTDQVYATASQHLELCQHICHLLHTNRRGRRPIATSTRLYLLDFLIDLRPSPENRIYRLDIRTYHVLRRILSQIGSGEAGMNIGERHFLQDVLRWTVDCHRERVVSRVRMASAWDSNGDGRGRGAIGRNRIQRGPVRNSLHITGNATGDNSVRCHRCHQYGNTPFFGNCELIVGHRMVECRAVVEWRFIER